MKAAHAVWLAMSAVDIKIVEYFAYLERQGRGVTRAGERIFPSQRWLATRLGVSERTIRRSIAHLQTLGVILVRRHYRRDRRGRVYGQHNTYVLLGLAGAFMRGLMKRLTDRPQKAAQTRRQEKKQRPESFFALEPPTPETLRKLPLLGVWWGRGG